MVLPVIGHGTHVFHFIEPAILALKVYQYRSVVQIRFKVKKNTVAVPESFQDQPHFGLKNTVSPSGRADNEASTDMAINPEYGTVIVKGKLGKDFVSHQPGIKPGNLLFIISITYR